jgi:hypothetical protein
MAPWTRSWRKRSTRCRLPELHVGGEPVLQAPQSLAGLLLAARTTVFPITRPGETLMTLRIQPIESPTNEYARPRSGS